MPEVVQRDAEKTVEVAGHTCRQVAVETGTSVLSKFECLDCGAQSNSVTTFDHLDCETGEFDGPEDLGESPSADMRVHRDVNSILADLEGTESILDVEVRTEGTGERVGALLVRIDTDRPIVGTGAINPVLRDHGLLIISSYTSPSGDLMVRLGCPEVSRFAA